MEASPILEGSNASAEGISKRTTIGDSTDNNDSSRYDPARSRESGDLCDLELGPDELSDEVLAVFEQVRNDQRTCEEQLSSEQKKREVCWYDQTNFITDVLQLLYNKPTATSQVFTFMYRLSSPWR